MIGLVASAVALAACSEPVEPDARDRLCGRLVRFHLGLHHPVEISASERSPGTLNVRIAYRGTRQESAVEGTALCRLDDQTGALLALGAFVDGTRVEDTRVQAFNRFVRARGRLGG